MPASNHSPGNNSLDKKAAAFVYTPVNMQLGSDLAEIIIESARWSIPAH